MGAVRRWFDRRRPRGEAGMTLMELMIGMSVMTVVMGICTGAVVGMFSSTSKTQGVQNSGQQLNTAFLRLDKQVRYATTIDQPTGSVSDNNLSVAFQTVGTTSTTCTQLRIRTMTDSTDRQLVERSWPVIAGSNGSTSAGTISGWTQLAGGISLLDTTGTAVTPFTVATPAGGRVQQLRLRMGDIDRTGKSPTNSFSDIVFSALNSTGASAAAAQGTPAPVCAQAGTA